MKKVLCAVLAVASAQASAVCPTPTRTGNPVYDNFAQQQFYTCLSQQGAAQQPAPASPQAQGRINFGALDTSIPERAGRSGLEMQRQQLENERLRLQIEQMRRQMNQ